MVGPFTYKFYRHVPSAGTWTVEQDWSPEGAVTWTPAAGDQGTSAFQVWVRNAGSAAAYDAYTGTSFFTVGPSRPLIVTLTADRPPSAVGMETTWTATPDGGSGPLEYRFWRTPATGPWRVVRDWLPSPTFTWLPIPDDVGTAGVQVWVRHVGAATAYDAVADSGSVVAPSRPLTVTSLTADVAPDRFAVGQPVTWTATTDGGTGALEYLFYQYRTDTGTWTLVQPVRAELHLYVDPAPGGHRVSNDRAGVGPARRVHQSV